MVHYETVEGSGDIGSICEYIESLLSRSSLDHLGFSFRRGNRGDGCQNVSFWVRFGD
jgi:hypothetical protein